MQHLCWGDMELINHCHFYYAQAEYDSLSKAEHVLSEKNDLRSRAFFFPLDLKVYAFRHLK